MSFRVVLGAPGAPQTYLTSRGSRWVRGSEEEAMKFSRRRTARAALGAWLADDGGSQTPIAVVIEKVP